MMIYSLLLAEMILWGLYPLLTHYFVLNLNPLYLVSLTSLVAAFPFVVNLIVRGEPGQLFLKENLEVLLPVAAFTAIGHILLFIGTRLTSGANTGLLLQVEPVYSLIIGVVFFREILGKGRVGATLIMVLGAMIIVFKGDSRGLNVGDLLVLLTPLMYQISHALAKRLMERDFGIPLILAGRQLYASVLVLFLARLINKSFVALWAPGPWLTASFLGLYLALVALLWYAVIKRVPVSVASSFLPLTALVSLVGSALFLKETISAQQYFGFFFIVGGLLWSSRVSSLGTKS